MLKHTTSWRASETVLGVDNAKSGNPAQAAYYLLRLDNRKSTFLLTLTGWARTVVIVTIVTNKSGRTYTLILLGLDVRIVSEFNFARSIYGSVMN